MTPIIRSMAALALACLPLSAQAPGLAGPARGRLARALNLSEAQAIGIRSIQSRHQPELIGRRAALRQARSALQSAARDSALPEAQLRALHGRIAAAQLELLLARRALRQEVRALLTPEQQDRAAAMRAIALARFRAQGSRRDPGTPG